MTLTTELTEVTESVSWVVFGVDRNSGITGADRSFSVFSVCSVVMTNP
jgi:hypothetical protein